MEQTGEPLHFRRRSRPKGNSTVRKYFRLGRSSLKIPSDNAYTSTAPDHTPQDLRPNENTEPDAAANEEKPSWKSTAYATAKLPLCGVRDSADAFGPLKSVTGGLCFVLENCEVQPPSHPSSQLSQESQRTKANAQIIESLAPRVKALAETLCAPVSEGDVKELRRRKKLEQ